VPTLASLPAGDLIYGEPGSRFSLPLTVTGLATIEISSVGDIVAPDLEADKFSIAISSTGDLTLDELIADELDVDMSSTGSLDIAGGEVKPQKVTSSSTGTYTAKDLVSDEAEVRLSSTGDLRYRGDPTVDATTSSMGDVIQIGE
jgi:hypothetical protein